MYLYLLNSSGSGGNNHALQSFEETKYPLAVKLGTITPDGAGRCFFIYASMHLLVQQRAQKL